MAKSSKSKASQKANAEEAEIINGDVEVSNIFDESEVEDSVSADDGAEASAPDVEPLPEKSAAQEGDETPIDVPEPEDTESDKSVDEFDTPEAEVEAKPETELETGPEAEPEPVASAPEPEEKKSGFVPLLLGGVIAAGIGYAVPTFLMPQENAAVVALQAQVAALEANLAAADASAAAAQGQAQQASDAVAAIMMPDLTPLEQAGADMTAQLVQIEARMAALENRPVGDNSGITEGDFANLSALLAEQQAASAALTAEMERMAALQAEGFANAETEALNAARAAQTAAALQVVRTALDTGEPFDAALSNLENVPDALVAVATDGVATAQSLQDAFPDLSRAALAKARTAAAEGDAAGSIMAFVQKQVGARSVTPREGDDPDAVLSRAEAAVRSADWTSALAEITALPDVAQAPLADWSANAQTRAAALAALSDLEATN